MRTFVQDFRYAVRLLIRNPGFAFVSIVTLALGIGVTTSMFSVVHAVLLRPLPYADPDRLVIVRAQAADGTFRPLLSGAEIQDLRARSDIFSSVGGLVAVGGSLTSLDGVTRGD